MTKLQWLVWKEAMRNPKYKWGQKSMCKTVTGESCALGILAKALNIRSRSGNLVSCILYHSILNRITITNTIEENDKKGMTKEKMADYVDSLYKSLFKEG